MSQPLNITQILVRITAQGAAYCPMCRYGEKHGVSIECLERFWRPLIPRKYEPNAYIRGCFYYHGTPLTFIYAHEEFGYAVACVHYALAMCAMSLRIELFWSHVLNFLAVDQELRKGSLERKFCLVLHVIETLAWRSSDGFMFPTPLICWYLPHKLFEKEAELIELVRGLTIEEYKSSAMD